MSRSLICRIGMVAALHMIAPVCVHAQDNPLSSHARLMYSTLKLWVGAAGEKMPEEHYGFKPTTEVRSFGEILAHVADNQYRFCSLVLGEKPPTANNEKTKTGKGEILAALKDAFAYCDRAYSGMNDVAASEIVKLGPGMPKVGVLTVNSLHTTLHYGNLITYMRLKNVVPPSSDPAYMPQPPKR